MKRQDRAHLLTGAFEGREATAGNRQSQLTLLRGLARAVCRHGRYAVTILRNADGEDLAMFGLEHRQDALRLARTLQSKTTIPFGSWLSHRSFTIDAAAYRRIAIVVIASIGQGAHR